MITQVFPSGPFETNSYVIACPSTRQAAIIDPAPQSAEKTLAYLKNQNLDLQMILLTHSHWDHITDVSKILQFKPVPVYLHELDTPNLIKPGSDHLPFWIPFEGVSDYHLLEENDTFAVGTLNFKVIHTPGHTPGSICFFSKEPSVLISGDTLFKGSIGNLSFPTSQPELMHQSLQKLARLPPKTEILPGHGPATTLQQETWIERAKEIFDL